MSKLSPSLKTLINAPSARPGPLAAPARIRTVYESIANDAAAKSVPVPAWLSIATATTMTLNSPDSMSALYDVAGALHPGGKVKAAALMREVGLKCMGFNGIPRTINMLAAFRAVLPEEIRSRLTTTPTRTPTSSNIDEIASRGFALWKSIYHPLERKLYDKLAESHPDLPVHILHSEYGALFADPPTGSWTEQRARPGVAARVGRVLTSLVAIACLRSQTGVGPQVVSHVFGLRKAFEDGSRKIAGGEGGEEGEGEGEAEIVEGTMGWLASDEGCIWVLQTTDCIVEAFGGPHARESKL